ncbi:transposase [Brucella intermedia]|uniref:transposase n=1 Tax=Brucella intermedia TaxID=94625 RepID=UPI00124CB207|nr:transposase [Brucella intermedia]KAB2721486.1 transposase [Brucella intermedia]
MDNATECNAVSPVSVLDIVELGRRRFFTREMKLRIVAESYSGKNLVTATAKRYGIARTQLNYWRQAAREGRLGVLPSDGFIPAVIRSDEPAPAIRHVATPPGPSQTGAETDSACTGRLEVIAANGRRVIVDRGVDIDVLVRIIGGLERL